MGRAAHPTPFPPSSSAPHNARSGRSPDSLLHPPVVTSSVRGIRFTSNSASATWFTVRLTPLIKTKAVRLLLRDAQRAIITRMITSFRHKGLRKYFESGSQAGIQPAHANRLKMQLTALDTAQTIEDMDIPGFRLHPLKGSEHGRWSIWVNGNWRVTFEFENGNALILDYEDYH